MEVVLQLFIEVFGYIIWGILEAVLTKAGGFLGGLLVGGTISIVLFWCLSSFWIAALASCGTLVVTVVMGLLIESAGATQ
ncbi:MAG: hypothetical protein V4719_09455 [Planctomycetota bacterium]